MAATDESDCYYFCFLDGSCDAFAFVPDLSAVGDSGVYVNNNATSLPRRTALIVQLFFVQM